MTSSASITVSLEVAKELKKAGWPQGKTEFYYVYQRGNWDFYTDCNCDQCWTRSSFKTKCDAPTAEEVLRRLPFGVAAKNSREDYLRKFRVRVTKIDTDGWSVSYFDEKHDHRRECLDKSLADAAAKMWIYLKKHDLLPQQP